MNNSARITLIDIETSPIKGYTWGIYDQNVLSVIEPSKIICFAWKDLNDKEVSVRALPDYDNYKSGHLDDKYLVEEAWHVLDDADIVVAHNLEAFDLKKLNTRFIANSLNSPSFYETIDTLKVSKKYFKFDNNSLNELGLYLHEGQKQKTGGFGLWLDCMEGNPEAWDLMKKYNANDVALLEKIYLRLRPYIDDHPNLNIVNNSDSCCPVCLSKDIEKRGFSMTRSGRKQRYSCKDCGSWSSGPSQTVRGVIR